MDLKVWCMYVCAWNTDTKHCWWYRLSTRRHLRWHVQAICTLMLSDSTSPVCLRLRSGWKVMCSSRDLVQRKSTVVYQLWYQKIAIYAVTNDTRAQEIFVRARYAPDKSHWWCFHDFLYRLVRISSVTFCPKPQLHAHHITAKCSRCFWKSWVRCHCRQMFASIVSLCSKLFCSLKGTTGQNHNEELIIHGFCHSRFALLQCRMQFMPSIVVMFYLLPF